MGAKVGVKLAYKTGYDIGTAIIKNIDNTSSTFSHNWKGRKNAMLYDHIIKGIFKSRPNRFLAHVMIRSQDEGGGQTVACHVKNTGRCRELLLPGTTVLLQFHPQAAELGRKTEYSLIGVYKKEDGRSILINMDSQAPNQVAFEWLDSMGKAVPPFVNALSKGDNRGDNGGDKKGNKDASKGVLLSINQLRREVTYGSSRFDLAFRLEYSMGAGLPAKAVTKPAFMEVKGVTLEEHGIAMFPDAPTERGVRHILEMARAVSEGYEGYLLFVIQMKGVYAFTPNWKTQPQFGDALLLAQKAGVHILAYDCIVTEDSLTLNQEVAIRL